MPAAALAWTVTAVAGLVIVFALWLIHRWQRAFREASRVRELSYGTVTLEAGREFPVSSLRMHDGGFTFTFGVTGPLAPGRHVLVLRGADGLLVARTEMDLPRRLRVDPVFFVSGTFRVDPETLQCE